MTDSDSNTLARIDERTMGLTTSFAAHVKDDGDKFEKVFSIMTKRFDKIDERFDKIDGKIEPIQNESNQRKGAFQASRLISGALWGSVVLAVSYFFPGHRG